jgi:hypothetical protein
LDTLKKTETKLIAAMIVVFVLSPLWLIYFANLTEAAWWVWAWVVVWAIFVYAKWDDATKGLFLIGSTCLVAVIGRTMVKESAPVLDTIQQMMLLVAGGVGGNFITTYLKERKARTNKR